MRHRKKNGGNEVAFRSRRVMEDVFGEIPQGVAHYKGSPVSKVQYLEGARQVRSLTLAD